MKYREAAEKRLRVGEIKTALLRAEGELSGEVGPPSGAKQPRIGDGRSRKVGIGLNAS